MTHVGYFDSKGFKTFEDLENNIFRELKLERLSSLEDANGFVTTDNKPATVSPIADGLIGLIVNITPGIALPIGLGNEDLNYAKEKAEKYDANAGLLIKKDTLDNDPVYMLQLYKT